MMTDPAGVGRKLRELSAEVGMLATGRDAGLWLSALESLARQADELEQQRDQWRASNTRVRAEAAAWAPTAAAVYSTVPESAAAVTWCAERIRAALDG